VPAERSDTYTVSYLAALLVLARLGVASGLADFTEADVMRLPDLVAAAALRPPVLDHEPERLLVLAGVGPGAVTAREGALKLREAARLPAEGYEAEYLLHGHAVPLDDRDEIILLVPAEDPEGLVEGMGIAARVEGINVIEVREAADLPDVLAQVPMTVALQSLAAHLADVRGQDPDSVILGAWSDPRLWPDPTIDR
jgi:glutamine---fructose-6-phosphate transaminase (isomerizing)